MSLLGLTVYPLVICRHNWGHLQANTGPCNLHISPYMLCIGPISPILAQHTYFWLLVPLDPILVPTGISPILVIYIPNIGPYRSCNSLQVPYWYLKVLDKSSAGETGPIYRADSGHLQAYTGPYMLRFSPYMLGIGPIRSNIGPSGPKFVSLQPQR